MINQLKQLLVKNYFDIVLDDQPMLEYFKERLDKVKEEEEEEV